MYKAAYVAHTLLVRVHSQKQKSARLEMGKMRFRVKATDSSGKFTLKVNISGITANKSLCITSNLS